MEAPFNVPSSPGFSLGAILGRIIVVPSSVYLRYLLGAGAYQAAATHLHGLARSMHHAACILSNKHQLWPSCLA